MATYNCKITIPKWLDATLAGPVVLWRWLWYGYTFRRIPLSMGLYGRVDPCRFHELSKYTWFAVKNGTTYVAVRLTPERSCNFPVYMHRQILNARKGQIIDHKNRNGLDNRVDNLRLANHSQNACNKKGSKNTSSKYKGVSWYEDRKCWRAVLSLNGKDIHLGSFKSEIEAAKAYDTAAKKYHGEFAYLNFPDKKEKDLRNYLPKLLRRIFRFATHV